LWLDCCFLKILLENDCVLNILPAAGWMEIYRISSKDWTVFFPCLTEISLRNDHLLFCRSDREGGAAVFEWRNYFGLFRLGRPQQLTTAV